MTTLLDSAARARLPLWKQIAIYLDPFALFEDASRGPIRERERALSRNRAMRWMLLAYLRRWIGIAAVFFFSISPAQAALPSQVSAVPAAALAVGFCIAVAVLVTIVVTYLLLGAPER